MKNKEYSKNKTRIVLAATITLLVILTSLLWMTTLIAKGKSIDSILPGGIAVLIALFMIPFIKRRYFDVKKGYPHEDERSKKILLHATAKAFSLSIWWMLALMFYTGMGVEEHGFPELIPRHVAAAGIIGMAIIFAISYFYVNWRGETE